MLGSCICNIVIVFFVLVDSFFLTSLIILCLNIFYAFVCFISHRSNIDLAPNLYLQIHPDNTYL